MKDDVQLVEYKKESFFEKIKNKIINIFSKKKNEKNTCINTKNDIQNIDKEEFFVIYQKAKKQEIDLETLDKDTVGKILMMTVEELNINNKKINQKLEKLEISLYNCKIYNKEIEMLRKA